MLEKAVAAVKADEAKAIDMFNKGEGGFKDRDLYVWCVNASDGILTAHPTNKGKDLSEIEGKHGAPFGQEIMENAANPESGRSTVAASATPNPNSIMTTATEIP